MRLVPTLLVLGALALSACDALGSDPGAFSVTVAGDAAASFEGEPVTTVNPAPDPTERAYQFRLAAPGNRQVVTVTVVTDGRPTLLEGTYPVQRFSGDRRSGRAEATADLEDGFFFSLSGTLTVTRVTRDHVTGSFEFEGFGDEAETATVRGTFDADLDRNAITA